MARFSGGTGSGDGAPGPQGLPGPTGPAGADGAQGPTGPSGADALWNFVGEYNNGADYNIGDVVTYNGGTYYRILPANAGYAPGTEYWTTVAEPGLDGTDGADGADAGFSYQGAWASETSYNQNDVVSYEGALYISTIGNNSNYTPTGMYWDLFVDKGEGFNWRGSWSSGTTYVANDTVEFEGSTYLGTPQNGGMVVGAPVYQFPSPNAGEPNPDWELMASSGADGTGFRFRGTWMYPPMDLMGTGYAVNDIVTHNGSSWILTNVSSAEQEPGDGTPPMNYWVVFAAQGSAFVFEGEWQGATTYQKNDVVLYEDGLYIVTNSSNMQSPLDLAYNPPQLREGWDLFLPKAVSFRFRGYWSSMGGGGMDMLGDYAVNDLVIHEGNVYLAKTLPLGTPGASMDYSWTLFIPKAAGFDFRGAWDSGTMYYENDIVTRNGNSWVGIPTMVGMGVIGTPGDSDDWQVFAAKGDQGTFSGSWDGNWDVNNTYTSESLVYHNGSTWLSYNNDNLGNEPYSDGMNGMMSRWSLVASGLNFRGAYDSQIGTGYRYGDIVTYNGSTWIATNMLMAAPGNENSGWSVIAAKGDAGVSGEGFNFLGPWQAETTYVKNDIVSYEGSTYILPSNNYNGSIPTDSNTWNLFASKGDSLNWRGEFSDTTIYYENDIVSYNENLYIATEYLFYISTPPTENLGSWDLFVPKGAQGDPASIDTGTTTINTYSPIWSGTGLDINPTAPVPPATGSYIKIGNLVQVQIEVDFTEVLDFGTGQYSITLPVESKYHTDVYGGSVHDAGATTDHYTLKGHLSPSSTVMTIWTISGSSKDEQFDFNSPINLTTADKFHMSFSYICE